MSKCLDSWLHTSEIENMELWWFIDSVATQSSYLCINNCGRFTLTIDHRINETVSDWKQMSHEM